MKLNWLESKVASVIFFWSSIIFPCNFMIMFLIAWLHQFANSLWINRLSAMAAFVVGVMGILSVFIIFFGMAVFCMFRDHSSVGAKAGWFVLFFFTGPIGSIVYHVVVYRGYVNKRLIEP